MIDLHAHILPGVDDGPRDFESSIREVKWLVQQGVTDIVATPHYVDETEYASPKDVNKGILEELKEKLTAEGVMVNLYLGNEVYISERIAELVDAGEIATLAGSKYLLVELPLNGEFMNYEGYLQELINEGFFVLLAHPERYEIMQENYDKLLDLHEMGVLFQSNLRSFAGKYGAEAEHLVRKLARDKLIFALASDTHRAGSRDYLLEARRKLAHYYNEREISQLLTVNPRQVLFDKTL